MTKPTAELIALIRAEYELNEKGMASLDFVHNVYPTLADRLAEQQKVIDGLKAEKENHSALCYAVAVSTLWGLGCQSEAADLAGELSVTLDSVKDVGLSEYDLDNLSELYKAFPWVNQKALQHKAEE